MARPVTSYGAGNRRHHGFHYGWLFFANAISSRRSGWQIRSVRRLIAADKDFEMLIVPGEDHFLDDNDYFNRRRLDFFVESLHGTPPPDYQFGEGEDD